MADIAEQHFFLPAGTRIEEYEFVSVIGHGSFGITYLAEDTNLGTRIAIKEYLPADWAIRDSTQTVRARNTGLSDTLERGKDAFLKEARILALVSHPNIVRVRRFFRAFGTAYIVMDFVRGRSLADILDHDFPSGGYPSALLERLMTAVLDGLGALHGAGVIHRDLKPANILIGSDGNPVLVDFGAARNFQRSLQRGMTVIMTPGYAPIEQYSDKDEQGPFTDIYAVGALAYRAITGRPPAEPYKRLTGTDFVPASTAGAGRYPATLLAAIDWALAVQPQARPRTAAALLTMLRRGADEAEASPRERAGIPEDATRLMVSAERPRTVRGDDARSIPAAPAVAREAAPQIGKWSATPSERRGAASASVQPARRTALVALAVLLGGGLVAAYVYVSHPPGQSGEKTIGSASVEAKVERAGVVAEPARQAAAPAEGQSQAAATGEAEGMADAAADAGRPNAMAEAEAARVGTAKADTERTAALEEEAARPPALQKKAPEQQAVNAKPIERAQTGHTTRGIVKVMGLSLADLTPDLRMRYALADDTLGVVVTGVDDKSQAAEKGARAGDVIVARAEEGVRSEVRRSTDVAATVDAARKSGRKTVTFVIGRQGNFRFLTLTLDQGSARATDPRCTAIVETAQLGEALSNEDRAYLRDRCR